MVLWNIFCIYSNAYVDRVIQIDQNTTIYPLINLSVKYECEYIDHIASEIHHATCTSTSNEQFLEGCKNENSIVAIQFKIEVDTSEPQVAFDYAQDKINIVTNFLSYYTKNAIRLFGLIASDDGHFYTRYVKEFPRKIKNITDEPAIIYNDFINVSENDPRAKSIFKVYYDALDENDNDFKFLKFYSLLEFMARPYGKYIPLPEGFEDLEMNSYNKIKALFKDLEINSEFELLNGERTDLIKFAKQKRHCVAHTGICSPEVRTDCKAWCKRLIEHEKIILNQLEDLINFVIRRYIIKHSTEEMIVSD